MSDTTNSKLAGLPAPPPPGSIQFFDGYFPALAPNTYNIKVGQNLAAPSGTSPSYSANQTFIVQAPEFFIDTTIIQTVYPPPGGFGLSRFTRGLSAVLWAVRFPRLSEPRSLHNVMRCARPG